MSTVLLAYPPLPSAVRPWMHLLQQQAVYETARAVLAAHGEPGPELSKHILFAPAHMSVLPILAIAARDFAEFSEPEGTNRPLRIPVRLYTDPSWPPEPAFPLESALLPSMIARLQHPAWFQPPVPLLEVVHQNRPEVCVAAGDPAAIGRQLQGYDHRFQQIIIFESLIPEGGTVPELPGPMFRLERRINDEVEKHMSGIDDPIARGGVWRSMLAGDESFDLEPFQPFGLGIEMALRRG
jgi:hypothetical protein